jgi:hypothetical protein
MVACCECGSVVCLFQVSMVLRWLHHSSFAPRTSCVLQCPFLWPEGVKGTEIHSQLATQSGHNCLSQWSVYELPNKYCSCKQRGKPIQFHKWQNMERCGYMYLSLFQAIKKTNSSMLLVLSAKPLVKQLSLHHAHLIQMEKWTTLAACHNLTLSYGNQQHCQSYNKNIPIPQIPFISPVHL